MATIHLSGTISLGELLVALGTLALAGITWRLSRTTRDSVAAATESADAERASVEAMAMPYVVMKSMAIEERAHPMHGHPVVRVDLLNIGSGPAIVTSLLLTTPRQSLEPIYSGLPQHLPIQSGAIEFVKLPVRRWPGPTEAEDAELTIEYLHSNGDAYATVSKAVVNEDQAACLDYPRVRR